MESLPVINLVSMVHLVCLTMWGGVVAAEFVLELYPRARKDLEVPTIRFHFWIDLLVELPLVLGVTATGTALIVLAWPLSALHVAKILCAACAIAANFCCIALVVRRKRLLDSGAAEAEQRQQTRRVMLCAAFGLPLGIAAAGMGFWLAYQRMIELVG